MQIENLEAVVAAKKCEIDKLKVSVDEFIVVC
jgi:hypothetical protein